RRAPVFAGFDQVGYWRDPTQFMSDGKINAMQFMVPAPVTDSPWAQIQDYLPKSDQRLAWKYNQYVPNGADAFQAFGQLMANDPKVQQCFVTRAWNNAFSRDDVVIDLALVPDSVVKDLTAYFTSPTGGNFRMKKLMYKL